MMSLGSSFTTTPPLEGEARATIGGAPFTYYLGWYWMTITWTDWRGHARRFCVLTSADRKILR